MTATEFGVSQDVRLPALSTARPDELAAYSSRKYLGWQRGLSARTRLTATDSRAMQGLIHSRVGRRGRWSQKPEHRIELLIIEGAVRSLMPHAANLLPIPRFDGRSHSQRFWA